MTEARAYADSKMGKRTGMVLDSTYQDKAVGVSQ